MHMERNPHELFSRVSRPDGQNMLMLNRYGLFQVMGVDMMTEFVNDASWRETT